MPCCSSILTRMVRRYWALGVRFIAGACYLLLTRVLRRGAPPVPDRRSEPRIPGVLRAARVDLDLDRRADERDLRLRLDAREDRHRQRRAADGRRLGCGPFRSGGDLLGVQGRAALASGPAQAAVARDGTARRGLRLPQRQGRGL